MKSLELRIPPPVIVLAFAGSMWLVAHYVPSLAFAMPWRAPVAAFAAILGGAAGLAGILAFRRARTTVNPMRPEATSALVATGIYRITRNPMYLGLLLMLIGWATWLSHPLAFALLPLFVAWINHFQIKPEERVLAAKFGDAFEAYRRAVRRWL